MPKAWRVFPELVPQDQLEQTAASVTEQAKPHEIAAKQITPQADPHVRATTLTVRNMHRFGELFVNYLKARREVFIVQKGWSLPEVDGMEFDQYDTPRARWIVIHEYGEILAGVRISPTTARCGQHSYMIRDAQLGLLEGLPHDVLYFDAPVDEHIWEATRLFVAQSVASSRRLQIQVMLMEQMAAAARREGASHVIGIVPAVFRRWMNRFGMSATPVGPVITIEGESTQAALMNVVL